MNASEDLDAEASKPESSVRVRHADGGAWSWIVRRTPRIGNVRLADWDEDGHCLVATTRGLCFWDGAAWHPVEHELDHLALRFVRFVGLGRWIVGSQSEVHLYAFGQMSRLWTRDVVAFECFDGSLDDAALVGGRSASGSTILCLHANDRWHRPLTLIDVAVLTSLSRIDKDRWLVTGHTDANKPYAAVVAPLALKMKRLRTGDLGAFAAGAGRTELSMACAVGSGGALVCDRATCVVEVNAATKLTAAAIDPTGRVVVAKPGAIWLRSAEPDATWRPLWEDHQVRRPIVALTATAGVVRALANDGTMLEGRTGEAREAAPPLADDDDPDATQPRAQAS
jgi:hypothetical protein